MDIEYAAQAVMNALDLDESNSLVVDELAGPDENVRTGGYWFEVHTRDGEERFVVEVKPWEGG